MKRYFTLILIFIAWAIPLGIVGYDTLKADEPVSDNFDYLINWHLGQNIMPYHTFGDCDDATLYDYYWLHAMNQGYKLTIMYSGSFMKEGYQHVWLVADNGTAKFAYDYGDAHDPEYDTQYFTNCYSISLSQLVSFVKQDLR